MEGGREGERHTYTETERQSDREGQRAFFQEKSALGAPERELLIGDITKDLEEVQFKAKLEI